MATLSSGYLGGFSGKLGPAVGYMWNGKWCLRSRPAQVRNPRSEAQVMHRQLFKQQVQLAARMRWAVNTCLTLLAREAGMTAYNLFVSLNQPCFGQEDGALTVDWASLQLSLGPVAPVALGRATVTDDGRLEVDFERNPLHMASNAYDQVRLYVYSPELGQGYLSAAVYRREGRVALLLPAGFAGTELHLYAFAFDRQGRYSATAYGRLDAEGATEVENQEDTDVAFASRACGAGCEADVAAVAAVGGGRACGAAPPE